MAFLLASLLVALIPSSFPSQAAMANGESESLPSSASQPHPGLANLSPLLPPHLGHHQNITLPPTHPHVQGQGNHDPPPHSHRRSRHHDKQPHELFIRPRYRRRRGFRSPREPLLPPYRRPSPPRIVMPPFTRHQRPRPQLRPRPRPRNRVVPPHNAHRYVPPHNVGPPHHYEQRRRHRTQPHGRNPRNMHWFPHPQHHEQQRHPRHENHPIPRKHWTPYHKNFPPHPHHPNPRSPYHHKRRNQGKHPPLKHQYHHKPLGRHHPLPPHYHEKWRHHKHSGHHHSLWAQQHHDNNHHDHNPDHCHPNPSSLATEKQRMPCFNYQ